MILVTGITGKIGHELLPHLAGSSEHFRLLVRDPSKVKAPANAELVTGDLSDAASLRRAMEGVSKVFLVIASFPGSAKLHNDAIDAAKKAGVGHVVRLSVNGADAKAPMVLGQWHGESDAHLQASGLKWTILRPGAFMQNLLGSTSTVKRDGAIYGTSGEGKVPFIDAHDIAGVAFKTLTTPGHEGKIYPLTGDAAHSYAEVAAKLTTLLGKPVKYVNLPDAQFKAGVLAAGIPEWLANDYLAMNHTTAAGHLSALSPVVSQLLGRARTIDEFLSANLAAFTG
jgi:uncharacterized protein YbjT (DUF2867 family)